MHDGIVQIVKVAEVMGQKADCSISQLESEGKEVTELDSILSGYNTKIEESKAIFKEARELLVSGTEDSAKAAHGKIVEGKNILQESHKIMVSLRDKIKEAGGKPCEKQEFAVEEEKTATEEISENFAEATETQEVSQEAPEAAETEDNAPSEPANTASDENEGTPSADTTADAAQ